MRFEVKYLGPGIPDDIKELVVELGDDTTRSNVIERLTRTPEYADHAAEIRNCNLVVDSDEGEETLPEGSIILLMNRMMVLPGG